jgi:molecular chaperone GrpE
MDEDLKEQQAELRTEELQRALDEERKRAEEYLSRWKYAQADFENLKKRSDRQLEEAKRYYNERLVMELLSVVDELEMAISVGCSSESTDVLAEGVEMTLKKLRKILEREGVSHIECIGKTFDPSKHDAVAKVEKEEAEDCTVIEEVRKGYTMGGRVIRPSIVKISVRPQSKSQEGECTHE